MFERPIPMVLLCPRCQAQHIDEKKGEWTNPPHRSHLCGDCGTIWRPADVPTTGVAAVSRGALDTWPPKDGRRPINGATRNFLERLFGRRSS